jgi:hypothetical protein
VLFRSQWPAPTAIMDFKENQYYLMNILVFGSIIQKVSRRKSYLFIYNTHFAGPGFAAPNHIPSTRKKTVIFLTLTGLNSIGQFAYVTGRRYNILSCTVCNVTARSQLLPDAKYPVLYCL